MHHHSEIRSGKPPSEGKSISSQTFTQSSKAHLVFIKWGRAERRRRRWVPSHINFYFNEKQLKLELLLPMWSNSIRSRSSVRSPIARPATTTRTTTKENFAPVSASFCRLHLLPFSACYFFLLCISPFSVSRLSCCQKILWRLLLFLCAARDTKMIIKKYKWERALSGVWVLNWQILCKTLNWNGIKTSKEYSEIYGRFTIYLLTYELSHLSKL